MPVCITGVLSVDVQRVHSQAYSIVKVYEVVDPDTFLEITCKIYQGLVQHSSTIPLGISTIKC